MRKRKPDPRKADGWEARGSAAWDDSAIAPQSEPIAADSIIVRFR